MLEVPRQDALYFVTAFSVSQQHGFGILERPLLVRRLSFTGPAALLGEAGGLLSAHQTGFI